MKMFAKGSIIGLLLIIFFLVFIARNGIESVSIIQLLGISSVLMAVGFIGIIFAILAKKKE